MTSKYKKIWDNLLVEKKLPNRCSGVIEISYDEFKSLSDNLIKKKPLNLLKIS